MYYVYMSNMIVFFSISSISILSIEYYNNY
jgi:hypothetical protein